MNLEKYYHQLKRVAFLVFIIVVAVFVFRSATQIAMQLYQLSMVAVALLVFHYVRKQMFPYIDLQIYAEKAKENPIASALVLMSVMAFLIDTLFISKV